MRFGTYVLTVVGLLLVANASQAQTLYSTGFEPPLYTDGSSVHGVDGWSNGSGSGAGMLVSSLQYSSGTQSLRMDNSSTSNSFYSVRRTGIEGWLPAMGPLSVSIDLFVDSSTQANRLYGIYLGSLATSTLGGTVLGVTIGGDGSIRGGTTWAATYSSGLFATANPSTFLDRWITLNLTYDPDTGVKSATLSGFSDASVYSNSWTGGAAPANLNLGTDYFDTVNRAGIGYFDNLVIAAVPEPTTIALCGLGLAGMTLGVKRARCRRRS